MGKSSDFRSDFFKWIRDGVYGLGEKLPSEARLSEELGISRVMIREGLAMLAEQGYVVRRHGAGTFVTEQLPCAKSNSARIVAAWVPSSRSAIGAYGRIVDGIEEELYERGYTFVLCNHRNEQKRAEDYLKKLTSSGICGILYIPMEVDNYREQNLAIIRRIESYNIPVVLLDKALSTEDFSRFDYAGTDGFDSMRSIVNYLAKLGHRKIAYIGSRPGYTSEQRYRGYEEGMFDNNLKIDPQYIRHKPLFVVSEEEGKAEIEELLVLKELPSAIVCLHDIIARNVCAAIQKSGLSIPGDISVTGFDDLPFAEYLNPALTTVRQPFGLLGKTGVELLLKKVAGESSCREQRTIANTIVYRNTCAAPSGR